MVVIWTEIQQFLRSARMPISRATRFLLSLFGSSVKHEYLHFGKHPLAQFRGLWSFESAAQELIVSNPVFQATNTRILCVIGYVSMGISFLPYWFGKKRAITLNVFEGVAFRRVVLRYVHMRSPRTLRFRDVIHMRCHTMPKLHSSEFQTSKR
jgi:hypothetical protein